VVAVTLTVVDHPLARHLLTELRDRTTAPARFRTVTKQLTAILALEATRDLATDPRTVETPLEQADGSELHGIVAVPILRAGLGMVEAVTELFPGVLVGHIGLERDEQTLRPASYYEKLPPLQGRHVLLLDPMLATGGSALRATRTIKEREPATVRMVCMVAAPEGVEALQAAHSDIPIVAAARDRELNALGYILPGLGDFGDRLYGT
jgi:uracil phosphoribosyltransferase